MWMASRRGPASAGQAPVMSLTSRCLARRSDTGARRRLMRRRARRLTAERARRGLRRPRAPSRTYFPREDCVFLRMTEGRPQSSAGKRSSRSRSTFPILHCAPQRELSWVNTSEGTPGETVMPALTATSALVGAMVLLGLWSGKRWGRRRKRVLDAEAHRFRIRRGS